MTVTNSHAELPERDWTEHFPESPPPRHELDAEERKWQEEQKLVTTCRENPLQRKGFSGMIPVSGGVETSPRTPPLR